MCLARVCRYFAKRVSPLGIRNHELETTAANVDYRRSFNVFLSQPFGNSPLLANLLAVTFEKVRLQLRCGIKKLGIKRAFQKPSREASEDCIGHG